MIDGILLRLHLGLINGDISDTATQIGILFLQLFIFCLKIIEVLIRFLYDFIEEFLLFPIYDHLPVNFFVSISFLLHPFLEFGDFQILFNFLVHKLLLESQDLGLEIIDCSLKGISI